MIKNILIICIGNICRSPMAEILLANKLQQIDPDIMIHSAGLGALAGRPADPMVQQLLFARGLDVSTHRAKQVSTEMYLKADLILTMDQEQADQIRFKYSHTCGRVYRIGRWSNFDIVDPFKRPKDVFEHVMGLLDQCVEDWCTKLWA